MGRWGRHLLCRACAEPAPASWAILVACLIQPECFCLFVSGSRSRTIHPVCNAIAHELRESGRQHI